MKLLIAASGTVSFVYTDDMAPILREGAAHVRRASHVEPHRDAQGQHAGYTADMQPVGGPVLGPFPLHRDAIAAELEWLDRHLFV